MPLMCQCAYGKNSKYYSLSYYLLGGGTASMGSLERNFTAQLVVDVGDHVDYIR